MTIMTPRLAAEECIRIFKLYHLGKIMLIDIEDNLRSFANSLPGCFVERVQGNCRNCIISSIPAYEDSDCTYAGAISNNSIPEDCILRKGDVLIHLDQQ